MQEAAKIERFERLTQGHTRKDVQRLRQTRPGLNFQKIKCIATKCMLRCKDLQLVFLKGFLFSNVSSTTDYFTSNACGEMGESRLRT